MTEEKIIAEFNSFFKFDTNDRSLITSTSARLFATFMANMAIEEEREACARLCEKLDTHPDHLHPGDCADAIRGHNNYERN